MIRVYSSQGWDVLKPYLANMGGSVDCLAPDSSGGVLAVLHGADYKCVDLLKSIPGVLIIPVDKAVQIPAAVAALPICVQYNITTSDTVRSALAKIFAACQVEHWNPNHAF